MNQRLLLLFHVELALNNNNKKHFQDFDPALLNRDCHETVCEMKVHLNLNDIL